MSEEIELKYAYCDFEKVGPKIIIRCPDGTLHVTPHQVRLGEEGEQFIPREELPLVTSDDSRNQPDNAKARIQFRQPDIPIQKDAGSGQALVTLIYP